MINREDYLNILRRFKDKELIKVITGFTGCGKSTLLELYKDYLLKNGVSKKQIISLNLEDLKYNFINDYMSLYNYIESKLIDNKKNYVIIDEVQKIKEFEKAVDSLYIKKNVDLYITESNAFLLSSELATLLSGRYIEIKMLPLSFKEYQECYKSLSIDDLYKRYISLGSLPYVTSLDNEDDVSIYLGNILSVNNIANAMASDGRNINVRTVEKYLEGFTESFFLYKASRYDIKGKQHLKTGEKY